VTTRFRTRAFFSCFFPFALLLTGSFWMAQETVRSIVREGLRNSLRKTQAEIAAFHAQADLQNSRFLKIAGENTALKAGMQLLAADLRSDAARRTVEDQLHELGEHMGFDFMLVSAPDGSPLAGVWRQFDRSTDTLGQLVPLEVSQLTHGSASLVVLGDRTFQTAFVPVDENEDNIGILTVGEFFDLSKLSLPGALVINERTIKTNISQVSTSDLDQALSHCTNQQAECDLQLNRQSWISLPVRSYGGGYTLLSFQNVDEAAAPVQSRLRALFLTLMPICVLVALLSSFASSRSIVRPISEIVSQLRKTAQTGKLLELECHATSIREVQELSEYFNRAATSVRAAGEHLEAAYIEFVWSLANALDARDPYTAGHSRRVSHLSCAIASAMSANSEDVERIRIGAVLHDIGKIGIADTVLQKAGSLTEEEFAIIKQHAVIGRRILESVHGFAPYLPAVELHHENWDGTGYPWGQRGEETPLDAHIIHVADAYDAMTSNRSYRRGMTHEKAISILIEYAGTQFDPRIVDLFVNLPPELFAKESIGVSQSAKGLPTPSLAVTA
jgi:putative nucleotidyltransferase with HDIG domain